MKPFNLYIETKEEAEFLLILMKRHSNVPYLKEEYREAARKFKSVLLMQKDLERIEKRG